MLDSFNRSDFGIALDKGGIGQNSKRFHRVTTQGLVNGWVSNPEIWNTKMVVSWDQEFSFTMPKYKLGQNNWSCLQQSGSLFGSDENPITDEVMTDVMNEFRSGSASSKSMFEIIDITGLTPSEYGNALRISGYQNYIANPIQLEYRRGASEIPRGFMTMGHKEVIGTVEAIADRLSGIGNNPLHTLSWMSTMRNRPEKKPEVIDMIERLVVSGVTPKTYAQLEQQGLNNILLIEKVMLEDIDINLALQLQEVELTA